MKKFIIIAILILLTINLTLQEPQYVIHELSDYPEAICINGKTAKIGIAQRNNNEKILIFFDKILQCKGYRGYSQITYCEKEIRRFTKNYQYQTQSILQLSDTLFSDYTIVRITSCEGYFFQGDLDEKIVQRKKKFYIKGKKIMEGVLDYLNKTLGFSQTSNLLVAGEGDGGVSAMLWIDRIKNYIQQRTSVQNLQTKAIYDNSLQLDIQSSRTYYNRIREFRINTILVALPKKTDQVTLDKCAQEYYKSDIRFKCLFQEYTIPYSDTPSFYFQPLFSIPEMAENYRLFCLFQDTIDRCPKEQRDLLRIIDESTQKVLDQLKSNKQNGYYISTEVSQIGYNIYNSKMKTSLVDFLNSKGSFYMERKKYDYGKP